MVLPELALCFAQRPGLLENHIVFTLLLLDMLCGAAMAVGVAELVRECIARLDRTLPKRRLYRDMMMPG